MNETAAAVVGGIKAVLYARVSSERQAEKDNEAPEFPALGHGALTYTLLQNLGLFLDFLIPLLMIVFHTLGEELIKLWHEFQHLKQHARQGLAEKR